MKKNFTLIELLTVICIMSIVAAMLLPALGRARSHARLLQCSFNMKNLLIGLLNYADENNGIMAFTMPGKNGIGRSGGWVYYTVYPMYTDENGVNISKGTIYSYCGNSDRIFKCPVHKISGISGKLSYALNNLSSAEKIEKVSSPSEFIYVLEEKSKVKSYYKDEYYTNDGQFWVYNDTVWIGKHLDKTIFGYFDGHVYNMVCRNDKEIYRMLDFPGNGQKTAQKEPI